MCFHYRLVFSCGHYVWLKLARPCNVEEAFIRGETSIGCSQMWSTGFCTRKTHTQKCETCSAKEAKTGAQIAEIRRRIAHLRGLVDKITKTPPSSSSASLSGEKKDEQQKKTDEDEKRELLEAGVVFDDEYEEALLEDLSPVSSPVFPKVEDFSEP